MPPTPPPNLSAKPERVPHVAGEAFMAREFAALIGDYEQKRAEAARAKGDAFPAAQQAYLAESRTLARALRRWGKTHRLGDWVYGCDRAGDLTRTPAPTSQRRPRKK